MSGSSGRRKDIGAHEGEPGKDEIECLIEELDVNPEFAREGMRRAVYVMELDRAVNRSKERAIEPPPSLRDQLWNLNRVKSAKIYAARQCLGI